MCTLGLSEVIGIVQIIIGISAIGLAIFAYLRVLEQIKISDIQTNLTIDQMKKLSEERLFELKLKVTSRIGDNLKLIREMQEQSNYISGRIQVLLIETEQNYNSSLEAIQSVSNIYRQTIQKAWDMVAKEAERIKELKSQINEDSDIRSIENVLMKIEQNQFQYDAMFFELTNIDKSIDKFWYGLKTGDTLAASKIINNLV
nr:hypothetical protein [uncultured Acinetobacter sp.]